MGLKRERHELRPDRDARYRRTRVGLKHGGAVLPETPRRVLQTNPCAGLKRGVGVSARHDRGFQPNPCGVKVLSELVELVSRARVTAEPV